MVLQDVLHMVILTTTPKGSEAEVFIGRILFLSVTQPTASKH